MLERKFFLAHRSPSPRASRFGLASSSLTVLSPRPTIEENYKKIEGWKKSKYIIVQFLGVVDGQVQ